MTNGKSGQDVEPLRLATALSHVCETFAGGDVERETDDREDPFERLAVDTPATIAVLGAGPIGLEAALYGRFLGYTVNIYERGRVGENLLRFGHVRLFTPFQMNSSNLGLAALEAQDSAYEPPVPESLLTAQELVASYLRPLAESDLLADGLHEQTSVVAVGRDGPLKGDLIGKPTRADYSFRLLVRDANGNERVETADVVIDASGTYGNPNWLGHGGVPAIGERDARLGIEHGLPDLVGRDRPRFENQRVLVVGAGYSAATNIISLVQLAAEAPSTKVYWATRGGPPSEITRDGTSLGSAGPVPIIPGDRLPERLRIAQVANALAGGRDDRVNHWPGTTVAQVRRVEGGLRVWLVGEHARQVEVDRLIANVGFRPDNSVYGELQVHECYASGGPMKWAAALLSQPSADCLDQRCGGAEQLINPEPNFYILGSKSYGRNSKFLIERGLEQIRDVFTLIGGRAGLDLYKTVRPKRAATF